MLWDQPRVKPVARFPAHVLICNSDRFVPSFSSSRIKRACARAMRTTQCPPRFHRHLPSLVLTGLVFLAVVWAAIVLAASLQTRPPPTRSLQLQPPLQREPGPRLPERPAKPDVVHETRVQTAQREAVQAPRTAAQEPKPEPDPIAPLPSPPPPPLVPTPTPPLDLAAIEERLRALDEERRSLLAAAARLTAAAPIPLPTDALDSTHNEQQQQKPFRVLFVCDYWIKEKSMSRWFYDLHEAMSALPGVEAELWGPGFPGYHDNLTVGDNVQLRWGVTAAERFDFFLNNTIRHKRHIPWFGAGANAPPVAVWQHECVLTEKIPARFICPHHDVDLTFHAYPTHMAYYADWGHGRLLWHLPHAVHLPNFPQPTLPHSQRPIDVLLAGSVWSLYPLRVRFRTLIRTHKLPGTVVHLQHPGYWVDGTANQTETYAHALLSTKIALFCSSKRRYAVRKYVEAAAAGALVIADIPQERQEEFRSWVVEVSPSAPDSELINTVSWWLNHSREREERARFGQQLVLSRYTTMHAAREMIFAMKQYIAGVRGLVFPHPFTPIDHFLPATRNCATSLRALRLSQQFNPTTDRQDDDKDDDKDTKH